MITLSIIIPVYNKISYLQTLFHQLGTQTFRDFECIIVDDGSQDGSGKICDQFAQTDSRIRVYHIPNGGVSHARNVGLDHAKGTYITFIDADDEIFPNYLENLVHCGLKSNADMVIGGYEKFWESGKKQTYAHPDAPGKFSMKELLSDFGNIQNKLGVYGYCWAKLFRSELTTEIRFNEAIRLAEDFDFYLQLYPKVQCIYLDDKPFYRYRQEAENSSVLVNDDRIDYVSQLRINLRYRDFLASQNAFTGENRQIVEQKINNYLYFSLYHCPQVQLEERFAKLYEICVENNVVPWGEHGMQKLFLDFLRKNQFTGVKAVLSTYRSARAIRNSLRKIILFEERS